MNGGTLVDIDPTYENAAATCPACQTRNVYNRRSDLKTDRPISRASVTCGSCGKAFAIGADLINPAHEMLLMGCQPSLDRKQYTQVVLGIAQAYEVFFDHVLHVRLVYRPFVRGGAGGIDELKQLGEQLYAKVKRFTFAPMRQLVLRLVVDGTKPENVTEAQAYLAQIPANGGQVPRGDIEAVADQRLRTLLLDLEATKINTLRNQVVHKDAYRPTREEAATAYDEARKILFGLTAALHVQGSAEYYINGADDED